MSYNIYKEVPWYLGEIIEERRPYTQDNLFNSPKKFEEREPILGAVIAVLIMSANPEVQQTVLTTLHNWIAHLSQFIG